MEQPNLQEHINCFNYDHSDRPIIGTIHYEEEEVHEFVAFTNEIVAFMTGRASYKFKDFPECEIVKGEIVFVPVGMSVSFKILEKSEIVVFRLYDHIKLCECFLVERLFGIRNMASTEEQLPENRICHLTINPKLQYLFDGLLDYIDDGIQCKCYFDIKIKEFFMLIRTYYTKEQLHDFLYLILSNDTAFFKYVKQNWHKYRTVIEFSRAMNLSQKQFSKKFKSVFGKPAYQWMKENKASAIYGEIISGEKNLKRIAFDYGFYTMSQFTKFCKTELGRTPSEIRANPSNTDEKDSNIKRSW